MRRLGKEALNMRRVVFLWLILPAWILSARAEDPAELVSLREKAQFAYVKITEEARTEQKRVHDKYLSLLKDTAQTAQSKGDLNAVLALKKAIEQAERAETLSDLDPVIPASRSFIAYSRKIETDSLQRQCQLFGLYLQQIDLRVTRYTKEGRIDEAVAFKKESATFEKRLAELKEKLPQPGPAPAPVLPAPGNTYAATLYITCDNGFTAWLNGKQIAASDDWRKLQEVELKIREGDILAIEATDQGPGDRSAGLFCCIIIPNYNGKKKASWGTDESWSCSTKKPRQGWQKKAEALDGAGKMDKGNTAPDHRNRTSEYRHSHDNGISGEFVWSSDPAPKIYVKEIISLKKFK